MVTFVHPVYGQAPRVRFRVVWLPRDGVVSYFPDLVVELRRPSLVGPLGV